MFTEHLGAYFPEELWRFYLRGKCYEEGPRGIFCQCPYTQFSPWKEWINPVKYFLFSTSFPSSSAFYTTTWFIHWWSNWYIKYKILMSQINYSFTAFFLGIVERSYILNAPFSSQPDLRINPLSRVGHIAVSEQICTGLLWSMRVQTIAGVGFCRWTVSYFFHLSGITLVTLGEDVNSKTSGLGMYDIYAYPEGRKGRRKGLF